ncbi:MAG: LamG-like jellyroll fold domain-containing protein [Bacteroidota bacterium]
MKSKLLTLLFLFMISVSFCQTPGNALDFDGVNDYVVCPLPAVFTNIAANDFTVEAWVNSQGGVFNRILFAQNTTSNFVALGMGTANTVFFYVISSGTTYSTETATSITTNQWTHIAARWKAATQTVEVFINGVPELTSAAGGSSNATSNTMTIGARTDGAQFFEGAIDEIRIWNIYRADCSISANMNTELTGSEPNLVTYYKFNHGNAGVNNAGVTTLADSAGTANGTLTGFTLNGTSSNWITSGAVITSSGMQATVNTAVGVNGNTLSSLQTGGTYQWIDCNNGNAIIPGQTNQSYTPATSGNYAVIVSQNNCTDTSICYVVNVSAITTYSENSILESYLNPVKSSLYINLNRKETSIVLEIFDVTGKIVQSNTFIYTDKIVMPFNHQPGLYFARINNGSATTSFRFIKE